MTTCIRYRKILYRQFVFTMADAKNSIRIDRILRQFAYCRAIVVSGLYCFFRISGFPDLDRFVAGAFYQGEGSWAGDHLSFPDAVPEWGGWLIPLMVVSIALVFYAGSLWQGDTG